VGYNSIANNTGLSSTFV